MLVLSTMAYAVAGLVSLRLRHLLVGGLFLLGGALLALLITQRWIALGQGPFISMYEVLVSGLFGLSLVYGLAYLGLPGVRIGAPLVGAVLAFMGIWAMTADPGRIPLPATYGNPWLWAHVLFGKLFLGSCLIASSIAGALLFGCRDEPSEKIGPLQDAWRWLSLALVFHTAMLVAGAVWAQDAWGRYWDWDPLETWAFATWLSMALALHLRSIFRLSSRVQQAVLLGIFLLAFATFFGVPFLSLAPHKGAI